jgi:hypothetical protein
MIMGWSDHSETVVARTSFLEAFNVTPRRARRFVTEDQAEVEVATSYAA